MKTKNSSGKKSKKADDGFDWPFMDLPNTVVLAHRAILEKGEAIVQVAHEEEDGAWQFLDGVSPKTFSAACMVSLKQILKCDPTLAEIAELPMGWRASRKKPGEKWVREKLPELPAELKHDHHENCPCCDEPETKAAAPKRSRVKIRREVEPVRRKKR